MAQATSRGLKEPVWSGRGIRGGDGVAQRRGTAITTGDTNYNVIYLSPAKREKLWGNWRWRENQSRQPKEQGPSQGSEQEQPSKDNVLGCGGWQPGHLEHPGHLVGGGTRNGHQTSQWMSIVVAADGVDVLAVVCAKSQTPRRSPKAAF